MFFPYHRFDLRIKLGKISGFSKIQTSNLQYQNKKIQLDIKKELDFRTYFAIEFYFNYYLKQMLAASSSQKTSENFL